MSLHERVFCEALKKLDVAAELKKRLAALAALPPDVGTNPALGMSDSPPTAARGEK